MGILKICLFGKFRVSDADTAVSGFEARRVQELFSYLLLQADRPHPRESLASLLWSNQPTSQSKKYLRQALWQLQGALENCLQSQQPFLLTDAEWIQIDPAQVIHLDINLFAEAYTAVRGIPGRQLTNQHYNTLVQAIALYQGDLLEGWYQDWCLFHRERFQNMYLAMLDKLMGYCETFQAYEEGIHYGTHILAIDTARERTHRRLMRLHYLAGDRTTALRQYQRCVSALRQELGVDPAYSTQEIYEQIRTDSLIDIFVNPQQPLHKSAPNLSQTLFHLQQIQTLLDSFQSQLQRQIKSVQSIVDQQ